MITGSFRVAEVCQQELASPRVHSPTPNPSAPQSGRRARTPRPASTRVTSEKPIRHHQPRQPIQEMQGRSIDEGQGREHHISNSSKHAQHKTAKLDQTTPRPCHAAGETMIRTDSDGKCCSTSAYQGAHGQANPPTVLQDQDGTYTAKDMWEPPDTMREGAGHWPFLESPGCYGTASFPDDNQGPAVSEHGSESGSSTTTRQVSPLS